MATTSGRAARLPGALLVIAAALLVAACSAGPAPSVSFDPNAPSLTVASQQFDKSQLAVPANAGFDLVLHNNDSVQHNVSIYTDAGRSQRVFGGDIVNAGTHVYRVQALAPGTYYFQCDLHPSMKGTITAAAS